MSDIRFYHLQRQTLDQALPRLAAKVLDGGHRIVIRANSPSDAAALDKLLWTYDPNAFLPHGVEGDKDAAYYPVWITTKPENPNNANVLILCDCDSTDIDGFEISCDMFNGRDDTAVQSARGRWKTYADQGQKLSYYQQNDRGGWDLKASQDAK